MSDISLSISIMAHPSRKRYFPYLFKKLGNSPISIDGGWGIWENAKKAWKLFDPKANYHTVIQDDALICNNFCKKAEKVIKNSELVFKNRPHLINFYYDRMLTPSNSEFIEHQGFIVRSRVHWAVAICLPVNLISEMIGFCDKLDIPTDDERITLYIKSKGLKVYFPIPSLVDHRIDTESLIGNSNDRKAWRFIE